MRKSGRNNLNERLFRSQRKVYIVLFNVCERIQKRQTSSQREKLTPVSNLASKFKHFLFLYGIPILNYFGIMSH